MGRPKLKFVSGVSDKAKKEWSVLSKEYRQGAAGFIRFIEENACLPIYPENSDMPEWVLCTDLPKEKHRKTSRSYWEMWEAQKDIIREALQMEDGRFRYRLIVFCWMRGEGKSLLACLVQLWKFFCWPRQMIVLGANSKDQIKFVHYDIIRDVILHSPRLFHLVHGLKNIKEKEIVMPDENGKPMSVIRAISSFSGIVSNITGYTFSEIFDMKQPRFFVQLDGSIRNVPNAMGVIDSTVSKKDHVLYQLFQAAFVEGKTKGVYFSYRSSKDGKEEDFWNPNMTQDQLDDYRIKFPFGEFERYFGNLWSAGNVRVFSDEVIEAWNYLGIDGQMGNQQKMIQVLEERNEMMREGRNMAQKGMSDVMMEIHAKVDAIDSRFISVDDRLYRLQDKYGQLRMAGIDELGKLGDLFDTDWSVGIGIDRADPMKVRTSARTVLVCLAKGLAGSRHLRFGLEEGMVPKYLYFLLYLTHVESSSLNDLKHHITELHREYDGVDMVCGERWGMWDLVPWCEEMNIPVEIVYPTYDRQKEAFAEMYSTIIQGRFKAPHIPVNGSKGMDILKEECTVFDHDPDQRIFGSPEKSEKFGVQDDSVFSLGWGMYGMRLFGIDEFRPRNARNFLGFMLHNRELLGKW